MGIDDFLAAPGPAKRFCYTCRHEDVKQIEADSRKFVDARNRGAVTISWEQFVRRHLRPTYNYRHDRRTLMSHLESCCGWEI